MLGDEACVIDTKYTGSSLSNVSLSVIQGRLAKFVYPGDIRFASGLSLSNGVAGEVISMKVKGVVEDFSGLTSGSPYVLSDNPGEMLLRESWASGIYQTVGQALSPEIFWVNPQPIIIPGS